MGTGTRLVELSQTAQGLEGKELWTSKDMKPDFNDLLIQDGYLYGFDNAIFACVDLKDGARKWKGGRYEKGQALLLADSKLIVVVSERGGVGALASDPREAHRARHTAGDERQDVESPSGCRRSTVCAECGRSDLLQAPDGRLIRPSEVSGFPVGVRAMNITLAQCPSHQPVTASPICLDVARLCPYPPAARLLTWLLRRFRAHPLSRPCCLPRCHGRTLV